MHGKSLSEGVSISYNGQPIICKVVTRVEMYYSFILEEETAHEIWRGDKIEGNPK
jgi:hypothetical protein